jgi:hypothetical protein
MVMRVKQEVERLFRAFNRKKIEPLIDEFTRLLVGNDYTAIRRSVQEAIDKAEFPTPAELRKAVRSKMRKAEPDCLQCQGHGWKISNYGVDEDGFHVIGSGKPTRCGCGASPSETAPKLLDSKDIMIWSIARIMAKSFAKKAVKTGGVESLKEWANLYWNKEYVKEWVALAKEVAHMHKCVLLTLEVAVNADPGQCLGDPLGLARQYVDMLSTMKDSRPGLPKGFQHAMSL